MATNRWLMGCGTVIALVLVIAIFGLAYFASRAGEMKRGIENANERYVKINREFPFTAPSSGELASDRFTRYIRVRRAVQSALVPLNDGSGVLGGLSVLPSLPEEVSRAQVDALREQSMSIDEYRWITRQIYTTVAAEKQQPDPDETLVRLKRDLEKAFNRRGGVTVDSGSSSRDPFDAGLLDFTWLRVPAATRAIVRENASEITRTADTALADALLLHLEFDKRR